MKMNISDSLYELAFAFRKSKIWTKLHDAQIFAVRLSGGETAYCCVLGMGGELYALNVYVGEKQWNTYQKLLKKPQNDEETDNPGIILIQDCLQCAFDNKDELTEEELTGVYAYAKAHQLNLRGKFAFPQFIRYRPHCEPATITEAKEEQILKETLLAVLELAGCSGTAKAACVPSEIPYLLTPEILQEEGHEPATVVPLRESNGTWTTAPLPPDRNACYEIPVFSGKQGEEIKKMKKKGTCQAGITYLPASWDFSNTGVHSFPALFVMVSDNTGKVSYIFQSTYPIKADSMLRIGVEDYVREAGAPAKILVPDEESAAFLSDFSKETGISVKIQTGLKKFEKAAQETIGKMMETSGADGESDGKIPLAGEELENSEKLQSIIAFLNDADDEDLDTLPLTMLGAFDLFSTTGLLPKKTVEKLHRYLEKRSK